MLKVAPKRLKEDINNLDYLAKVYKKTKEDKILLEISKKTDKLLKYLLFKNWIKNNYGELQYEDLYSDCKTIILLRALNKYNPKKNMKFTSYYSLWLRSYIRAKKGVFERRKDFLTPLSMDYQPLEGRPDFNLHSIIIQEENLTY